MTDEVGDVTVTTETGPDGTAHVRIQYTGSEEWHPHRQPHPMPPGGLAALHELVVEAVKAGAGAEVPGGS
ncbi:hypothetical protein [Streptomyces sp. NPDC002104]